jgi:membrane-associated phospholipid phosphatase
VPRPWLIGVLVLSSLLVSAEPASADSGRLGDDWLVGGFDSTSQWTTAGLALGLGIYLSTADVSDIRDLGDVTQFIPGAFGLVGAFSTGDRDGVRQFGVAAGTTFVAIHGLKQLGGKERPDGSDDLSFPSGHTAASAMGAAFVWRRYGAKWGAPMSVLAAYTGISRVRGQKHYADDVVSGAAIGLMSNLFWTHPIDDRVRISLFPTDGGAGVAFEYNPSAGDGGAEIEDSLPGHFFAWEMGLLDVSRNRAAAPAASGTVTDWRFDQNNNPSMTGIVGVGWLLQPGSRHGVYGVFSPFEVREGIQLTNDIEFGGETFTAGSEVSSRFVANDYRVGYGYTVLDTDRWGLVASASVEVFDTLLELSDGSVTEKVSDTIVRPVLGVRATARLSGRWMLIAAYSIWDDSEITLSDTSLQVGYRLNQNWLATLGYRSAIREIDTDELISDLRFDQYSLGVSYFW